MKFAIATQGCKINQYDSQLIREALLGGGHQECSFSDPADLYIINTCTVTHRSDAENRKLIRRALKREGRVLVTGCQAVTGVDELREGFSGVEVVPFERLSEALHVDFDDEIHGFAGHSRAFVKVQQGCDNFCSYCIVPYTRGYPVARPAAGIIAEIRNLVEAGFHEVVLTGINIGLYDGGLAPLLKQILGQTAIGRIRISSIEPWTVDDELLDVFFKEERICRHLHLPLQHGCDRILKAMNRPYETAYYATMVEHIHRVCPEAAIGTDIMVGFPGEDRAVFDESLAYLRRLGLAYMHVFPYSRRSGTPAAGMPDQVEDRLKKERTAVLRDFSASNRETFIRAQLGKVQQVLVTGKTACGHCGITSNYLKVTVDGRAVSELEQIRLERICGDRIAATVVP